MSRVEEARKLLADMSALNPQKVAEIVEFLWEIRT